MKNYLAALILIIIAIPFHVSGQTNPGLVNALMAPRTDYRARAAARQEAIQLQQAINQNNAQTAQIQMQRLVLEQQEMIQCANQVRELWGQYAYPATYPDGSYKVHIVLEGAVCEIKTVSVRNNRIIPTNPLRENDSALPITKGRGIVMRSAEAGQPSLRLEYYFIYQ